jgi:pilus assembly protein CpaF
VIARDVHEQNLQLLLAPIAPALADPEVSEVMVNGPSRIFIERHGRIESTSMCFEDDEALMAALRGVAQFVGRVLDAKHPILEGRLPDGSRVEAVLPPAAPDGPALSIRRFARTRLSLDDLIERGSISSEQARVLVQVVRARRNVLVSGGTGSGKTSLLNLLSGFVASNERVIVIEDARELQLEGEHVVQLEAQPADARGHGAVSVRQLFCATLRMRPDRIVVGEIRGREALDLIQAMTSGHGGCLATVHASHPRDALARLETLALMSDVELPLAALRNQIASAVDVLVQTAREADGSRRVTELAQVSGLDEYGRYQLTPLTVSQEAA